MDYKLNLNKHRVNGILYSISYFTTIPVNLKIFEANKNFYQGVLLGLPMVGILLSLLVILFYIILPFHPLYSAILSSVFYLLLTGFLHFEAVGDTVDGWYASYSKKDIYDVMHEPQVGSIGAMGMFVFAILEISGLVYCLYEELYFVIFLAFVLSRIGVYFSLSLDFHHKSLFILSLKESVVEYKILNILFFPLKYIVNKILTILKNRLGFLNGDMLGFMIVVLEIIVLNIGLIIWI